MYFGGYALVRFPCGRFYFVNPFLLIPFQAAVNWQILSLHLHGEELNQVKSKKP
jgi:hypothetical protein